MFRNGYQVGGYTCGAEGNVDVINDFQIKNNYMYVFSPQVCMCTAYVPGAFGSQKRVPDLLELQMNVSCTMDAEN